jgi:hypothetical protein
MAVARVPRALAERLGDDGTEGLIRLVASTKAEWTDEVLTTAVDRFDRRLTTEISSLRVDYTREMATLRQDITEGMSALRQDFTRDLSSVRVELLKWSFLFWIGQVAAIAGLLAFMLRT